MASSYTSSLRLTLPVTGENSGTWGDLVNTGITNLVDASVAGYAAITMTDENYTLTVANGMTDEARKMMLNLSGTLTAARNVICPTVSKLYFVKNATTGGFAITLKTSAGTGVSVPNGRSMVLMCDGTNVREAADFTTTINTTNLAYTGTLTGGTGVVNLGSGQFYKDASGNIGIGTASPTTKLDISQSANNYVYIRSAATSAAGIELAGNGNSAGTTSFGLLQDASSNAYVLQRANAALMLATNNIERMRVSSTGNVGIGTNTPGTKLVVENTSVADGVFARSTSFDVNLTGVSNGLLLGANYNNGTAYVVAAGSATTTSLVFATANNTAPAERMRIDSSGNMIPILQTTAPALATNQQMVFNLTSDTNLRISVRGSDGVTRTANITLA